MSKHVIALEIDTEEFKMMYPEGCKNELENVLRMYAGLETARVLSVEPMGRLRNSPIIIDDLRADKEIGSLNHALETLDVLEASEPRKVKGFHNIFNTSKPCEPSELEEAMDDAFRELGNTENELSVEGLSFNAGQFRERALMTELSKRIADELRVEIKAGILEDCQIPKAIDKFLEGWMP